jgi:hypothetical protein
MRDMNEKRLTKHDRHASGAVVLKWSADQLLEGARREDLRYNLARKCTDRIRHGDVVGAHSCTLRTTVVVWKRKALQGSTAAFLRLLVGGLVSKRERYYSNSIRTTRETNKLCHIDNLYPKFLVHQLLQAADLLPFLVHAVAFLV